MGLFTAGQEELQLERIDKVLTGSRGNWCPAALVGT
jgi:hypothetical protein